MTCLKGRCDHRNNITQNQDTLVVCLSGSHRTRGRGMGLCVVVVSLVNLPGTFAPAVVGAAVGGLRGRVELVNLPGTFAPAVVGAAVAGKQGNWACKAGALVLGSTSSQGHPPPFAKRARRGAPQWPRGLGHRTIRRRVRRAGAGRRRVGGYTTVPWAAKTSFTPCALGYLFSHGALSVA